MASGRQSQLSLLTPWTVTAVREMFAFPFICVNVIVKYGLFCCLSLNSRSDVFFLQSCLSCLFSHYWKLRKGQIQLRCAVFVFIWILSLFWLCLIRNEYIEGHKESYLVFKNTLYKEILLLFKIKVPLSLLIRCPSLLYM